MEMMATRMSFVLLLFTALGLAQTGGTQREFPLDSIAIEGNRILTASAIIRASGLKTGVKAGSAAFDAARDTLLGSGYFETVGYRFKPSAKAGYELTFDVREVETLYSIRVDALPATTDEVVAFLKTSDPLFTGKMPGTKLVLDRTAREIEQLLESKKLPAPVAGKLIAAGPDRFEVSFTPARGLPVVASVEFEGSKIISAIDLHNKMAEVAFGQPFTETGFRLLLENQIRAQYEAKGYMHVTFAAIATQPAADVLGLDVKVTVDEGAEYKLSRVSLTGVDAGESTRILKTAKLPVSTPPVPANAEQIKGAAGRVKDALRHRGFLDASVITDWKSDEDKKTVEFFLHVNQGSEYQFGKLTINGLDLTGEAAIRKIWSVKSGDSFPAEYPDFFLAQVKEEGLFDNMGDMKAVASVDRNSHVVDVALDFKGAPRKASEGRIRLDH